MSYIMPNTKINICKDVPLDNTFQHTIYWDSRAAQISYFATKTKYILDNQSYQRVERGKMRVQLNADNIYDCNYICFQNTAYGSKWFYAFITGVEYINDVTSEVTFEIDPIQTYWFNADGSLCTVLKACFVEREHAQTDEVGENLIPENLEIGDYVSDDFDGAGVGALSIVVAVPYEKENGEFVRVTGAYYSNIYSGLAFHAFTSWTAARDFINELVQSGHKDESIVSVFMMSTKFVVGPTDGPHTEPISKAKQVTTMCGKVPRNKKLLTYPYNFLYVTNLQGGSAEYHYEYFSDDNCTFDIYGDMTCDPSLVLVPKNYKGVTVNYDEKLGLAGYPQCAYSTDSFKSWLAQNAVNIGLTALGSAIAVGTGLGSANLINNATARAIAKTSVVSHGVSGIGGLLSEGYQRAISPMQTHGTSGNSTNASLRILDFAFMHKHIREEYMDIIDSYFDMFGYATHKVKVPNRNVRAEWTYTKTKDCVLECSAPADDVRKICEIYDNGITFWYNPAHVGDYSLPNPVAVG